MNRKKKISQIIVKRRKQAHAKNHPSTKPRYISKAERAEMAELAEKTVLLASEVGTDIDTSTAQDVTELTTETSAESVTEKPEV